MAAVEENVCLSQVNVISVLLKAQFRRAADTDCVRIVDLGRKLTGKWLVSAKPWHLQLQCLMPFFFHLHNPTA
jgi:hypothetical protein